jgi:hypothetical protein
MEDGETPLMHKYGQVKMTQFMMSAAFHVTFGVGCMKFQAV